MTICICSPWAAVTTPIRSVGSRSRCPSTRCGCVEHCPAPRRRSPTPTTWARNGGTRSCWRRSCTITRCRGPNVSLARVTTRSSTTTRMSRRTRCPSTPRPSTRCCTNLPPRMPGHGMDLVVKSELVEQVRAFVDWVGTGRKLTQTGRITLTDARMLVAALGTDDVIDPTIGDRVYRTTSSQDLHHLTLIVEWTKAVRLVRKTGNRLVPVKKNQHLLNDP